MFETTESCEIFEAWDLAALEDWLIWSSIKGFPGAILFFSLTPIFWGPPFVKPDIRLLWMRVFWSAFCDLHSVAIMSSWGYNFSKKIADI